MFLEKDNEDDNRISDYMIKEGRQVLDFTIPSKWAVVRSNRPDKVEPIESVSLNNPYPVNKAKKPVKTKENHCKHLDSCVVEHNLPKDLQEKVPENHADYLTTLPDVDNETGVGENQIKHMLPITTDDSKVKTKTDLTFWTVKGTGKGASTNEKIDDNIRGERIEKNIELSSEPFTLDDAQSPSNNSVSIEQPVVAPEGHIFVPAVNGWEEVAPIIAPMELQVYYKIRPKSKRPTNKRKMQQNHLFVLPQLPRRPPPPPPKTFKYEFHYKHPPKPRPPRQTIRLRRPNSQRHGGRHFRPTHHHRHQHRESFSPHKHSHRLPLK